MSAAETAELWSAFGRGENTRVPIQFACDEQVWLKVAGHTFRAFYTDPRVHLEAQLEGRRWLAEQVPGDQMPPEHWTVAVQWWMEENEFCGAEVVLQDDDYAWALPLALPPEDLLRHVAGLDAEERIRDGRTYRMWQALGELADGLEYAGRPVHVAPPGGGTHGVLTKAAELRGIEQLCLDFHERPDFAAELLRLLTEKTLERICAWHRLTTGQEPGLPYAGGWGMADDSLQLISTETYQRFVLPCHQRLYTAMTTGARSLHVCGHASQHYAAARWQLGVTHIDGPGPFVDHGRWLRELGPEFSFAAQTDHSVLERGTPEAIDAMLHGLLSPGAKLPGRFQVVGWLTRHTPLENVHHCYAAGRRWGRTTAA